MSSGAGGEPEKGEKHDRLHYLDLSWGFPPPMGTALTSLSHLLKVQGATIIRI